MKIVSLIPSATYILYALGLEEEVLGITYACPQLNSASNKKIVVKPKVDTSQLSESEIDTVINIFSKKGESLYEIDYKAIEQIKPDIIIAQSLCDVCAVTPNTLNASIRNYGNVIEIGPKNIDEILQSILIIGEITGKLKEARDLVNSIIFRIENIKSKTSNLTKKRTLFLEWIQPPFCSGHWVPEIIEIAGGIDFGEKGKHSRKIFIGEILNFNTEYIIAGPCGFDLNRAYHDTLKIYEENWIKDTIAYEKFNIFAVEAKKYFSTNGPFISEAVSIMAAILHPKIFKNTAPLNSYKRVTP